jgi:hypothetical protein
LLNDYGEVRIVNGQLVHSKGFKCAGLPARDWSFPVSEVRLVGEFTTPGGPVFDYFYVFIVGEPPRMYMVPMEALESVGLESFFADLKQLLGSDIKHSLASSTKFASSIMWPSNRAGQPFPECLIESRPGLFGRILDRVAPRTAFHVVDAVSTFCGGPVEWAA